MIAVSYVLLFALNVVQAPTAVRDDESNGFRRCQADALDVRRRIFADERVEGIVVRTNVSGFRKRLCQMRPAKCTAFGDFGEGYLRFSVANSVENIEKALDRVGAWVGKNL